MEVIQLSLFGKMFPERSVQTAEKTSAPCWKNLPAWNNQTLQFLDLRGGADGAKPEQLPEMDGPWLGDSSTLNIGECPREEKESTLSQILEEHPPKKYYLTATACKGILRRAEERGKPLPPQLQAALEMQSGQRSVCEMEPGHDAPGAYHINQRNEGIDLGLCPVR